MKLGLGTVQFGLDYGISNTAGRTPADEVLHILDLAARIGISVIDTASMYGTSETVLGQALASLGHDFAIVTKTPRFDVTGDLKAEADRLEQTFLHSLKSLQKEAIHGLMFHHADDLLTDESSVLVERVCALKQQGLISKWGFSAYTGQQLDAILHRFTPDLVQVPVNVLDQRLLNGGQLKRLKQAGVEIHSRSAFLQGLLLMDAAALNPYFAPYVGILESFSREARNKGFSQLQATLKFVMDIVEIDHVIVGVCSGSELQQIVAAATALPANTISYERFACADEGLVNPALWKLQ